jgi:hypothetical protein
MSCGCSLPPDQPRWRRARCAPCFSVLRKDGDRKYRKNRSAAAKQGQVDYKKAWYGRSAKAKLQAKDYNLRRTYGITLSEVNAMLAAQGGACAVCGTKTPTAMGGKGKARHFTVDHDHATGIIRGILCGHCNAALGLLRDDPTTIERALAYIRRHQ